MTRSKIFCQDERTSTRSSDPENRLSKSLQVTFVPVFRQNPYQARLAGALSSLGVQVVQEGGFSRVLQGSGPAASESRPVLHLHWLPAGYWGPRNAFHLLRFGAKVWRLRRAGAVIVWTAHNLYGHESSNRSRERRLTRFIIGNADGVIVHSPLAEGLLRREFSVEDSKAVRAIPHGNYLGVYPNEVAPAAARARLGLGPDDNVVLFLGNIRPYKGVPELIEAFRKLEHSKARLVIAGQPLNEATKVEVARLVGADSRIKFFPGFVPDEDVQVYLNASDLVALPYLNVLTSGAAVLAMSFARACVAPRSGCMPDMLCQQPELLYDPTSPDGLTDALRRGLVDSPRVREWGERNLELAKSWSWERVGAETKAFYEYCASTRAFR